MYFLCAEDVFSLAITFICHPNGDLQWAMLYFVHPNIWTWGLGKKLNVETFYMFVHCLISRIFRNNQIPITGGNICPLLPGIGFKYYFWTFNIDYIRSSDDPDNIQNYAGQKEQKDKKKHAHNSRKEVMWNSPATR